MLPNPFGKSLGALLEKPVPRALGERILIGKIGYRRRITACCHGTTRDQRIAVDDYIAKVRQDLGRTVFPMWQFEEFRGVVDEPCGALARLEGGMLQELDQECDVGFDAANAKLLKATNHTMDGIGESPASRRHLDEQ